MRAALALSLATGCSSMRRVPPGGGGFQETIRRGDALRIVRSDGRVLEGYAVAVTDAGLVVEPDLRGSPRAASATSDLVAIPWTDVARVDRYQFSPAKTALAAGAVAFAAASLAFLAWMRDEWGSGWGARSSARDAVKVGR